MQQINIPQHFIGVPILRSHKLPLPMSLCNSAPSSENTAEDLSMEFIRAYSRADTEFDFGFPVEHIRTDSWVDRERLTCCAETYEQMKSWTSSISERVTDVTMGGVSRSLDLSARAQEVLLGCWERRINQPERQRETEAAEQEERGRDEPNREEEEEKEERREEGGKEVEGIGPRIDDENPLQDFPSFIEQTAMEFERRYSAEEEWKRREGKRKGTSQEVPRWSVSTTDSAL